MVNNDVLNRRCNTLVTRFSDQPSLLSPAAIDSLYANLNAVQNDEKFNSVQQENRFSMGDSFWFPPDDWRAAYRPYSVRDGVLFIPINGVLLHNFPWSLSDWATGYEYIEKAFERGFADASVSRIVMVLHSGGGEVAGCFDAVDRVFEGKGDKPVIAWVNDYAYSAAYAWASVADIIVSSRTGGVGSIGVVTYHLNMSEMLANIGLQYTYIESPTREQGGLKTEGNSHEPITEPALARLQTRLDETYDLFVATVSRNRAISPDSVRATLAGVFSASEAIKNGLVDLTGSFNDAITVVNLDPEIFDGQTEEDSFMTAQVDAATTEAATELAVQQATNLARTETKARIKAIMSLPEAASRPIAADHAAMDTDMTLEQATAFLNKMPSEKATSDQAVQAATQKALFDAAMTNSGNPELAANDAGANQVSPNLAKQMLASYAAAGGFGLRSQK